MKIISFKVAKAIKEAGYPQDKSEYNEGYAISKVYYDVYSSRDDRWYPSSADTGHRLSFDDDYYYPEDCGEFCVAPTYLDVWLWLWREKKIWIQVRHMGNGNWFRCYVTEQDFSDPEEAIIAAVKHIVEQNLI